MKKGDDGIERKMASRALEAADGLRFFFMGSREGILFSLIYCSLKKSKPSFFNQTELHKQGTKKLNQNRGVQQLVINHLAN